MTAPRAVRLARRELAPVDPLRLYSAMPAGHRVFWSDPERGLEVVASGVAVALGPAAGAERFRGCAAAVEALLESLDFEEGRAEAPGVPLLLGGFAFTEAARPGRERGGWRSFPDAELVLPECCVATVDGRSIATAAVAGGEPGRAGARLRELLELVDRRGAEPLPEGDGDGYPTGDLRESSEEDAAYRRRVTQALEAIRGGRLAKVVVARATEARSEEALDVVATLASLRARDRACRSFAFERDGAVFLGATPERLVTLRAGELEIDALAGSASRGASPEDDEEKARTLLGSRKERAEHAFVVRAIEKVLRPICGGSLRIPEAPVVRRLASIHHLWTPIRGRVTRGGAGRLVEVAGRLHPTPAVAGAPLDEARAWLAQHEGLDRGWYAGPVGWLDGGGDGEFAVALRSALLAEGRLRLFAGAGIVADSEPHAELRETRLKMDTVASRLCFGGEGAELRREARGA